MTNNNQTTQSLQIKLIKERLMADLKERTEKINFGTIKVNNYPELPTW